ncbi:MAG: glycosyltransferase [Acidimicrobiales bacterium]
MIEKPLRVLIIDSTSEFGGAFEIAFNLVKHASSLEPNQIGLVSGQPPEILKQRVREAFPCYHQRDKSWKTAPDSRIWLPWNIAQNMLQREVPAAYSFSRLIRDFGATIVHLNNGLNLQMSAAVASRLAGAQCVCSYRSYAHPSRLLRPLERIIRKYIIASQTVKDHLTDVLGVSEKKIVCIYDPVDTDLFSPDIPPADLEDIFGVPRQRKVVSIFGRLVPWKGHEVFLRAVRTVMDSVADAHAMIVGATADGDTAYGDELEQLSCELGIRDRTTFTGYRADMPQLMRASNVIVHASTMAEPFGTVVLEAMACGRPVVAMAEGGPLHMIDSGEHGFLVPPNRPEAMAQAIITLLTQPETAAAFGAAARARSLQRFSAPVIARQHLELYREVLLETG